MSTIITTTQIDQIRDNDHRRSADRFIVYRESSAAQVADKFFDDHEIFSLKFKCKAWNKVCRTAEAADISAIVPALCERFKLTPADMEIRFSRTAGCKCGCSPGFVGKLSKFVPGLSGKNVWMRLAPSDDAMTLLRAECIRQAAKLPAEIAAHAPAPAPVVFSNATSAI